MTLLFEKVLPDPFPYMEELHKITVPDSLCTQYDRPSLEEAIAEHVSRFSQGAVWIRHSCLPHLGIFAVYTGQHMMVLQPWSFCLDRPSTNWQSFCKPNACSAWWKQRKDISNYTFKRCFVKCCVCVCQNDCYLNIYFVTINIYPY